MSERINEDWIKGFLRYMDNTEPPLLYKEWTAVSTIAAVLQRKCMIELSMDLVWFPNMYVVLVGPSGARKGTAMKVGASLLRDVGINICAESITREALIQELNNSVETGWSGDTPVAHRSLTIYSQELTVFLGYNNKQLVMDLTDWFDCGPEWKYYTKRSGRDEMTNVWVNLMGATTPDLIQSTLPRDAIGGGLAGRMVFVFAPGKEKVIPLPFQTKDERTLRESLLIDLNKMYLMSGAFRPTDKVFDAYVEWRYAHEKDPPFVNNPNFAGYIERRPMHLMKLAMIMSASRDDRMVIDVEAYSRAVDLLQRTEVLMTHTFSGYGFGINVYLQQRVMDYISHVKTTKRSTLLQIFYPDIHDIKQFDGILDMLRQMGFCKMKTDGRTGEVYLKYNEGWKND